MGKRKPRSESSETLISCRGGREGEDKETESGVEEKGGFFACYLLTSLSPRHKGHTYIGFTVNPRRRIRQHNGEIGSGAWRTKSKRPWEMVLCIYGFPTNVSALQFEWAWQHPIESLAVRKAAAAFKSLSGLANKIKLCYTMLTLPAWQEYDIITHECYDTRFFGLPCWPVAYVFAFVVSLDLTVNFFSTKYKNHTAGCPSLPEHMRVQVCSMDELPCYTGSSHNIREVDEWDGVERCNKISNLSEESTGGRHDSPRDHDESIEESTNDQNNKISSGYGFLSEGSTNIRDDSLWESSKQTINDENGWKDEMAILQSEDFLGFSEDQRGPDSFNTSPFPVSSSFLSSKSSALQAVKNGDMFTLIEERRVEPDWPSSKELPIVRASELDQNQVRNPIAPCEVEVIDLLSPSPGYRISSCSKKRKASKVCPQVIDLTKSPIFV